jgi:hypothetical protein
MLQTVQIWTRGGTSRRLRVHCESSITVAVIWESLWDPGWERSPLDTCTQGIVIVRRPRGLSVCSELSPVRNTDRLRVIALYRLEH